MEQNEIINQKNQILLQQLRDINSEITELRVNNLNLLSLTRQNILIDGKTIDEEIIKENDEKLKNVKVELRTIMNRINK